MPKKPASPAAITPPDGWKDGEGFGFLYGHDAQGQSVDLVRLADLVRWLQSGRRISRKDAVKAIAEALLPDAMEWLYVLKPGDVAALVSETYHFNQMTPSRLELAKQQANIAFYNNKMVIVGRSMQKPVDRLAVLERTQPVAPGLAALRKYLDWFAGAVPFVPQKGGDPVDTLDWRAHPIAHLAIPRVKAHALYDWGAVDGTGVVDSVAEQDNGQAAEPKLPTTWAELKRYRKENPGHAWTQNMRAILSTEESKRKAHGRTAIRKTMADELGSMTPSGLGDQIRKVEIGTKSGRGRKAA